MTELKKRRVASAPPIAAWVDGDAGGVGKSTVAVLLAQAFVLAALPVRIFELDDQGKLARFLPDADVTALHGANLARDEGGDRDLTPVFAPLHEDMVTMPDTGRSLLLEIGGSLSGIVNEFVAESDLEEDLVTFDITLVVFLVMVASEESVRQVLAQLKVLQRLLPSAKPVLVLNHRDGSPTAIADELPSDLAKGLARAVASLPVVRVPKLAEKSRRLYERLGVPPIEIVSWHEDRYAEAIRRTGRPLLGAKLFVKDIAAWTATVQAELAAVLPFLGGDGHE